MSVVEDRQAGQPNPNPYKHKECTHRMTTPSRVLWNAQLHTTHTNVLDVPGHLHQFLLKFPCDLRERGEPCKVTSVAARVGMLPLPTGWCPFGRSQLIGCVEGRAGTVCVFCTGPHLSI